MKMTQEQIEIEAQNYLNGLDLPENADKQLILDNFKNGMAWAMMLIKEDKQQRIEKENETISNEEKARVLSNKGCLGAYISKDMEAYATEETKKRLSIYCACLEAMDWKDEQRWKPTEKQLDALLDCANNSTRKNFLELNSLYEELVKLYYDKR